MSLIISVSKISHVEANVEQYTEINFTVRYLKKNKKKFLLPWDNHKLILTNPLRWKIYFGAKLHTHLHISSHMRSFVTYGRKFLQSWITGTRTIWRFTACPILSSCNDIICSRRCVLTILNFHLKSTQMLTYVLPFRQSWHNSRFFFVDNHLFLKALCVLICNFVLLKCLG